MTSCISGSHCVYNNCGTFNILRIVVLGQGQIGYICHPGRSSSGRPKWNIEIPTEKGVFFKPQMARLEYNCFPRYRASRFWSIRVTISRWYPRGSPHRQKSSQSQDDYNLITLKNGDQISRYTSDFREIVVYSVRISHGKNVFDHIPLLISNSTFVYS